MRCLLRALTLLLPLSALLLCQGETAAFGQVEHRAAHPTPVVHSRQAAMRRRPEAVDLPLPPPPPPLAEQSESRPPAKPAAAVAARPKKPAPPPPDPNKGSSTGLALPRFAALGSDEVNLRAGPGMRYPIEWVYKRHYLPVEIEREFDVWRLVEMPDGTRGWVNAATLIARRTFDVTAQQATLRAQPQDTAPAVAVLKQGVIGRLRSCAAGSAWCRAQVGEYGGWLQRDEIWGMLPREVVAR